MAGFKLVLVLLVCAAVAAPLTVDAITCGSVAGYVGSCLPYLKNGGTPPPACCNGVRGLNSAAKTTADRQAICNCLKNLSSGINTANAAALPGKCGVSIPYKISPSTNCATIK